MTTTKEKLTSIIPPIVEYDWSAEEELQLFYAMEGLRPVGINKHFYMACISERLSKSLNRDVPGEVIWRHLGTMYKLKELDCLENLPFPNEEKEFSLPENDFSVLLQKKRGGSIDQEERKETPKSGEGPPSIIAVAIDSNGKTMDKSSSSTKNTHNTQPIKDLEKKLTPKLHDIPKRPAKRTRGSMSVESNSPSTTPPPVPSNKRRRI